MTSGTGGGEWTATSELCPPPPTHGKYGVAASESHLHQINANPPILCQSHANDHGRSLGALWWTVVGDGECKVIVVDHVSPHSYQQQYESQLLLKQVQVLLIHILEVMILLIDERGLHMGITVSH